MSSAKSRTPTAKGNATETLPFHQTASPSKNNIASPQNGNDKADDVEDHGHNDESTTTRTLKIVLVQLRRYVLLLGNICAWYTTNGMNGIAMQSLSKNLVKNHVDSYSIVATTFMVTALQLLCGAALGCAMLWTYARVTNSNSKVHALDLRHHLTQANDPAVSLLHGAGSLFTNLGFMYGSAAVVQIIKLLEPFETLFLTKILIPAEGKLITAGMMSSMTLTTGAAMGLIRSRRTSAPPPAVLFAILSGVSLSTRNVMQRRRQDLDSRNQSPSSPLERSLLQFTQLSLQSGVLMFLISLSFYGVLFQLGSFRESLVLALMQLNVRVLTWHPLYNAFSMITLGFCTAVTHSLLNAGKRVFAIFMAIVWFREGFSRPTAVGLFLVFVGGCWYTVESKGKFVLLARWLKPVVTILLLGFAHWVHTLEVSAHPS